MQQGSFALFQLGGVLYHNNFTSEFNNSLSLESDLKALILAHYMLKVFKQRAIHYNVTLPGIYF